MENILPHDLFEKAYFHFWDLVNSREMEFDTVDFKRLFKHRDWFFDWLHKTVILNHAKKMFGMNIKPSYSFLSFYNRPDSVCPLHSDRPQCKYTIDMSIIQDFDWPIYINFKPYFMKKNQAVCYSGTDHLHWRDRKPSKKYSDEFVGLAFFHFVDQDFKGRLN